ncbi:glutaredoxin (thioltransferase)-like protein [Camelus ferus]|nr:glutaredoxin (thioltransferase)-like protein [Camelus ferus]
MAQAFVNSKIQPGKVVVFIKPTCPYCRRTQELLSQLPFKQGLLEFVDITATGDTNEIQDYLQQLTGARTDTARAPSLKTTGGLLGVGEGAGEKTLLP